MDTQLSLFLCHMDVFLKLSIIILFLTFTRPFIVKNTKPKCDLQDGEIFPIIQELFGDLLYSKSGFKKDQGDTTYGI